MEITKCWTRRVWLDKGEAKKLQQKLKTTGFVNLISGQNIRKNYDFYQVIVYHESLKAVVDKMIITEENWSEQPAFGGKLMV